MAYEGLIGKIGKNIFEGSGKGLSGAGLYAGIGAGVGGVSGAIVGDDVGSGFVNGALLGAGVGASVNMLPKFVSNTLKEANWVSYNDSMTNLATATAVSYGGLYKSINKEGSKDFIQGVGNTAFKNMFKSSNDFAYNVTTDAFGRAKNANAEDLLNFLKMGMNTAKGTNTFLGTRAGREGAEWYLNNSAAWSAKEGMDKMKLATAVGLKSAFDSVVSHIINPTSELFKGKGSFENIAAGAMTAFGAYEGYEVLAEGSNGNWDGAFAAGVGFAGAKLAFSQGMNIRAIDKVLKEKDMTWGGVFKTAVGGAASQRMFKGYGKLTEDQINGLSAQTAGLFDQFRTLAANDQELASGLKGLDKTNLEWFGQRSLQVAKPLMDVNPTFQMLERTTSRTSISSEDKMKEMLHGNILSFANSTYASSAVGSAAMFGVSGMAWGAISDDTTMLEGARAGVIGGAFKGAAGKYMTTAYAKNSVAAGNTLLEGGKFKVNMAIDPSINMFSNNLKDFMI